MTRPIPRLLRAALLAGALAMPIAAHAVGPDYHRPAIALTPGYHTPAPAGAARAAALDAWWEGFGDPALTRVVERAEAQNLDLEQARDRLLASRAAASAAGAALAPEIDATGSASAVQQSLRSPIGEIGSHLPGFQRSYDETTLGVGASWEIDLFGGLRRGREAARADARGAADDAAAIRISVAAEAADAYLEVRAFQGRIAVAERQQAVEQDLVDLLTRRAAEGVSPERDLHEAQAALEGVRATLPPLQDGLAAQLNRLDVLMGAQAGTYQAELATAAPTPEPPAIAPGDGPAELLRRRPDVMEAEERLIAANARIGAAVSDYYPKVSISGLLGLDSLNAAQFFTGAAVAHEVSAGFSWRLFDFGRVDAEVAQARGREAEALAGYRATVYRATEEVEDAFTDLMRQQARAQALARQIDQLTVARHQAQDAYEGGVTSLVEVRDADRDLLAASDQLVQARAGAALAAVAAFRALGGGWRPQTAGVVAIESSRPAP
jgi:NodT family efflux transporter outer membrane factor (OMF) lipoprotein